jgi:hypothetical protein
VSKLCKMGVMCFTAYCCVDVLQVSEPKQEMTRLVDDSQTSDNIEDDVKEPMDTMTPMRLNLDKPNWAELSQLFSFSTSPTSPAQVRHQHLQACLISNQFIFLFLGLVANISIS